MSELLPALIGQKTVGDIIEAVKDLPILKKEDVSFLQEHSKHLAQVLEKTHIWRTDVQKKSIINDYHFPTLHAKFHQAMLEQKVQFDQAMYLAKDFELKKLEVQELQCDLEDLGDTRRDEIKRRKLEIEIQFKTYELNQMQIAMHYRMSEVKGWQEIQENLLKGLRASGVSEEEIWSKNQGEISSMFFLSLNNLQQLQSTTDSAERGNLISAALFSYNTVKQAGLLEEFRARCNPSQLASLQMIEGVKA
jgi:hypothetical protein